MGCRGKIAGDGFSEHGETLTSASITNICRSLAPWLCNPSAPMQRVAYAPAVRRLARSHGVRLPTAGRAAWPTWARTKKGVDKDEAPRSTTPRPAPNPGLGLFVTSWAAGLELCWSFPLSSGGRARPGCASSPGVAGRRRDVEVRQRRRREKRTRGCCQAGSACRPRAVCRRTSAPLRNITA